ncbi:hypothetical protein ACFQ14_04855 [Pseudahrensia aquimaris]|uniref:Periplasmic heavy metal sensor n=1 Tax=Pseudahrensia aquimaris TaxID=744461 RepID=A0ABW3FB96_9HYPH
MFGRDAHKQREVVQRQGSRARFVFFVVIGLSVAAVIAVLTAPAATLNAWLGQGERIVKEVMGETTPQTPETQPQNEPDEVTKAADIAWPPVTLDAMAALGKPQSVFDPVARSRATSAIEKAFLADRRDNLDRLQAAFQTRLEALNAQMEVLQKNEPTDRRDRMLETFKSTAVGITVSYSDQTDLVNATIAKERDRRLKILRGL